MKVLIKYEGFSFVEWLIVEKKMSEQQYIYLTPVETGKLKSEFNKSKKEV